MREEKKMDLYSYRCGVIDAFNEVVAAGVKRLALSHPSADREERDAYLEFSEQICTYYGTRYYAEDDLLTCDLFAADLTRGQYLILYYKEESVLEEYLAVKRRKKELMESGHYEGEERRKIAEEFGRLLSYSPEAAARMIESNDDKE